MMPDTHPGLSIRRLKKYIAGPDPALQLEAVRSLRGNKHKSTMDELTALAANTTLPVAFRAEAVIGLAPTNRAARTLLFTIALGDNVTCATNPSAPLQGTDLSKTELTQLQPLAESSPLARRLLTSSTGEALPPATDTAAWLKLLGSTPGDPAAGQRLFYHPAGPGCHRCHAIDGRGATLGTDLSTLPRTAQRERVVESILQPSKEIAPRFVPWAIQKTDGELLSGLLVDDSVPGEQTYIDSKGELFRVKTSDIEAKKPLQTSIMPDDMTKAMTIQEVRDLLAFSTGAEVTQGIKQTQSRNSFTNRGQALRGSSFSSYSSTT